MWLSWVKVADTIFSVSSELCRALRRIGCVVGHSLLRIHELGRLSASLSVMMLLAWNASLNWSWKPVESTVSFCYVAPLIQCHQRQICFCFIFKWQMPFVCVYLTNQQCSLIFFRLFVCFTHTYTYLCVCLPLLTGLCSPLAWLSSSRRGLEQQRSPCYGAAQLARLDPGGSDSFQLLHIWCPQMWVCKQCTHSVPICSQTHADPPESPLSLLRDSRSGVRAEAKTISDLDDFKVWGINLT